MVYLRKIPLTAIFLALALVCMTQAHQIYAQAPAFRKWNVGLQLGAQPASGYTAIPVVELDYQNLALEISPTPMVAGAAFTYRFKCVEIIKGNVRYTPEISLFASRENGNYAMLFPGGPHDLHDLIRTGALAGFQVHFLERFGLRGQIGLGLLSHYGDKELGYHVPDQISLNSFGSLSLHVRLFNTFQQ